MQQAQPEWFYLASSAQQSGPVTEVVLRAMLGDGRLGPETQVWTQGMSGWRPAASALPTTVPTDRLASQAIWSLVLGLVSVFGLFVFIQLPAAIAGLVLGIRSLSSSKRGFAIAGIVLSCIGLVVMAWLAYLLFDAVRHVGLEEFLRGFQSQ